ncbi:YcxB family protein [Thermodesulfobacteriota bacterium]
MKLFSKITQKVAGVYALAIAILASAVFFGPPMVKSGAIGGLIGGLSVVLFGRLVISPFMARRHYGKYKAIQEPITIKLKSEGVEFATADGCGVIKWEQIFKWRQNDRYLLIYPMPRLYHIIPKSIVESGFNLSALVETLQSQVGKEA